MRRLFALALAALALTACDDHDHDEHDHDHEDPAAEACEHATDGPFNAVTAAAASEAPAIQSFTHSLVEIELAAGLDSVAFNAEEGEYVFFLSDDVPFALTADGMSIEIEETADVTTCDVLAVSHVADLPAGEVTLTFGPTDLTQIGLVFEEAGGEHDHD